MGVASCGVKPSVECPALALFALPDGDPFLPSRSKAEKRKIWPQISASMRKTENDGVQTQRGAASKWGECILGRGSLCARLCRGVRTRCALLPPERLRRQQSAR